MIFNKFNLKFFRKMENKYIFCIDAGHGGMVDGEYVTAPDKMYEFEDGTQIFEGVFNREVKDRVVNWAAKEGLTVEDITPENRDIALSTRVKRVHEVMRDTNKKPIFISIHGNAYPPDNSAQGWEVYTYPGTSESDKVATELFMRAKKEFSSNFSMRTDYSDGDPDREAKFYVLQETAVPAVLTENFFMTNYDDCKFMLSEDGKDRIAQVHVDALEKVEREEIVKT